MIAPTKHVRVDRSLLATGAVLLEQLERPISANALWERVRGTKEVAGFDVFVLTLSMLYAIGALEAGEHGLRRARG
ncbi:hypothetical protein OJ997_06515 [Solirubrobacter phytolaccae]|uniref:Uncharacterized protein n=1 Tax=Solirubrobacter phytolaccae TaxID=1404360 RepID=A0A9X3N7L2_9ACTN|nr:ABC-three component system middle component 6 [Solirubrobacter phytolaccae]MDA0179940.1 hypothetical protein [Solirubrobacter phytolaccae]